MRMTMAFRQHCNFTARAGLALLGFCALGLCALGLSGCAGFFVKDTTGSGTGTGTGTSTTNFAYVSNSATADTYINGYSLGTGKLVATPNSPYSLGIVPSAMVVTPNNAFLYVAADPAVSTGALYVYTIGTTGAISLGNSGNALVTDDVSSMDISPDGQWLFALDTNGLTMEEYAISSSTGAVTFEQTLTISGTAGSVVTPSQVKVAPSGQFVICSLGTGGTEVFSFNTTNGQVGITSTTLLGTGSNAVGDYAATMDSNNDLYIASTAGMAVYTVSQNGTATPVSGSPFVAGSGPRSLVLSSGNSFLYAGNQTDGTVSEYAVASTGVLTAVTGSPAAAPTTVGALARDSSGKYILAAGYNSTSGVQLYSIGSSGGLTLSDSAPAGTIQAVPAVVALTH